MNSLATLISSIGWPHVALVFAIIFIFTFKTQIGGFLSRVRSVGREGLKTEVSPQVQQEKEPKEEVEKLMRVDESPLLLEQEELIRQELTQRGLDIDGNTASVLIRHLAATQIALSFEFVYSLIFGSQIFLMKQLRQVLEIGFGTERMEQHFEWVKSNNPGVFDNWNVEGYLAFLLNQSLIIFKDGNYHITVRGVEFLIWLAKVGRPDLKSL